MDLTAEQEEAISAGKEAVLNDYLEAGCQWQFPLDGSDYNSFTRSFNDIYEVAVAQVSPKAGPGYPYRCVDGQNSGLLACFGEEIREQVRERCWRIISQDIDYRALSPSEVIKFGLGDPDRYFPKNQANPKRKALPRVIASASLVDQLVTRCFFQRFTEREGELYPQLCTKKGIGFDSDHAAKIGTQFKKLCSKHGRPPVVSDVSGWEKNFTTTCASCATHVIRGCCTNTSVYLARALEWWSETLFLRPGYLDDGLIIHFRDLKVQRSGNYLTTTSNGIARAVLAYAVGSTPFCCGDDCNEWPTVSFEELQDAYVGFGLPLRGVTEGNLETFEFCSHSFRESGCAWLCWLHSWERMLWEASRNSTYDWGTNLNYKKEIQDMPDLDLRQRIIDFIDDRARIVVEPRLNWTLQEGNGLHDKYFEENEDPDAVCEK